MVFAQAEKFDVFHHHHLVIVHAEGGAVQHRIQILVIAAGKKFQRFLKTLRRLAQSFAVRIFADQRDYLAHQVGHALLLDFHVAFVKQYLRWLVHWPIPSLWSGARSGNSSPAYSNELFAVSSMRTRSSLARGKRFKRRKTSRQTFSVVGTASRNAPTSWLSDLWSNASTTSRSTKASRSARFTIMPVAGSTFPET